MELQALVITTAHRGVFFGYGIPSDSATIRIERARMAVYWPSDNHGVVGLASKGPISGAKIGPAAPAITLRDITAVMECTPEAVKRWEAAPWT